MSESKIMPMGEDRLELSIACAAWEERLRGLVNGAFDVVTFDGADEGATPIKIFTAANDDGVLAATIGLMDTDQSISNHRTIFCEILMDRSVIDKRVAGVLSEIAFLVLRKKLRVAPGVVIPDIIRTQFQNVKLPHLIVIPPFQWEDMTCVELGQKTILPLLAVPISDAERELVEKSGLESLEVLWEKRETNVADWSRKSAI